MRKLFVLLAVAAALGVTGVASAAGGIGGHGDMTCGGACSPPGGWSGCKTIETSHSSSLWYVYSVRHAFRVSYCKSNGVITSIWGQTNYCDVSGIASCSPTVWFQTGGGRGSTWATFEAHALWTIAPAHIYNSTDVLTLTIPTIDG
jgi:hypothetical protein